jgi:GMP synthase (glutamine-hydrolysing)
VVPRGAKLLATTELEPNAALRFGERAWGVQFHPEFDEQVMTEYIETRADILLAENRDPSAMLARISAAEVGRLVLRRFVTHGLRPR